MRNDWFGLKFGGSAGLGVVGIAALGALVGCGETTIEVEEVESYGFTAPEQDFQEERDVGQLIEEGLALIESPGSEELEQPIELVLTPLEELGGGEVVEEEVAGVSATRTPIRVRSGENWVVLASFAEISPTELASYNERDVRSPLVAGEEIEVPLMEGSELAFNEARSSREGSRLDRFIEGKGGLVSVVPRPIEMGETVWEVATVEMGLPMWVVEAFNRDVDLNALRIGDEISLPLLGEMVAADMSSGSGDCIGAGCSGEELPSASTTPATTLFEPEEGVTSP